VAVLLLELLDYPVGAAEDLGDAMAKKEELDEEKQTENEGNQPAKSNWFHIYLQTSGFQAGDLKFEI
jgi:hypothetical protein